ncbi:MAG: Fic family protein [Gammaproteobacteria bacterium]
MNTVRLFSGSGVSVPGGTSWYLADLGEFRGKQALYTRQSPQRLKALREHALIESAVSSNRIEGVVVEARRVRELILGTPLLRDRDEEEVRGYRDALTLIHEQGASLPVSEETILTLHRLTRGEIWDAGQYKEKDSDIIERYADGGERVRFRTVPAAETQRFMAALVADWQRCIEERWIHPLIALAAFNLGFGMAMAGCRVSSCSFSATTSGLRSAATSAWSGLSSRIRNAITRRWSKVPGFGTRAGMILGPTSTMSCPSSRPAIKNLWSAWAICRRRAALRPRRCWLRSNSYPTSSRCFNWSNPALV